MDKIFIEQAKHIRKEYIKNVNDIISCEKKIEDYKQNLIKLQKDMENTDENLMKEKLMLIEKNIKNIENILDPHTNKMLNLEKQADILFDNIKTRHPNMTTEDIKNELVPHLSEIKY